MEGVFDITRARLKIVERELWKFTPTVCDFCEEPACAAVCPTDALITVAGGGVDVMEGKCIGCGKCNEVCKNHVIKLREDPPEPLVCDLCGGNPVCVDICPMQAILYENDKPG
jgi:Fe-S-cluster-containing dehydrogenase component